MSDEELDEANLALIRWHEENPDVWGDQDENGVDLARLRENLKLTPAERLESIGRASTFPILRALHCANVRFVLIGSVALDRYAPGDHNHVADVIYADDSENVEKLAAFLRTVHAHILGRQAGDDFTIQPKTLQRVRFLNLCTDLGAVDVMREVPGIDSFEGLWERAVPMDLGGFIVRVASLDDLIAMKRAANRPIDQAHLYELLASKKLIESETT